MEAFKINVSSDIIFLPKKKFQCRILIWKECEKRNKIA